MLLRLTDSDSRCFIIPTGHSPLEAPTDFGNAVFLAAKYAVQNGCKAITLSKYLHNKNWKIYSSSFNTKYTSRTIQKLYSFLDMEGRIHGRFIHMLYTKDELNTLLLSKLNITDFNSSLNSYYNKTYINSMIAKYHTSI